MQVWSFLIVVILCSVAGYFLVKQYARYHVDRKTKRMIEEFRKQQGIDTEDKPVAEVEKELLARLAGDFEDSSASGGKTDK